mmetsp:Transcript_760/g.2339  ORF Transcript_760/g.2339 Transcript_760/m.2339 type:complete len:203 (+) Transcript_760:621-1229(+)
MDGSSVAATKWLALRRRSTKIRVRTSSKQAAPTITMMPAVDAKNEPPFFAFAVSSCIRERDEANDGAGVGGTASPGNVGVPTGWAAADGGVAPAGGAGVGPACEEIELVKVGGGGGDGGRAGGGVAPGTVGKGVGRLVGWLVGPTVAVVGTGVGCVVGFGVGLGVGLGLGFGVGFGLGFGVGFRVGFGVGFGVDRQIPPSQY